MRRATAIVCAAVVWIVPALAQSGGGALPALKRQPSPRAVVDEHMDALNKCDWNRLMAQYPDGIQVFFPGGQVVKGRQEVGNLFAGFVKPAREGGLCGMRFESEQSVIVGNTVTVQWRATAPFLAEPYRGADAYITQGGLMQAQVTTFDGAQLKKR